MARWRSCRGTLRSHPLAAGRRRPALLSLLSLLSLLLLLSLLSLLSLVSSCHSFESSSSSAGKRAAGKRLTPAATAGATAAAALPLLGPEGAHRM